MDEMAALEGVTNVESVLDPPPGMPKTDYLALLALPADQRPAEVRAALDTYLADWIGGDTAKVRVFATQLPDSNEGRALVDDSPRRAVARRRTGLDRRAAVAIGRLHGQLQRLDSVGDRNRDAGHALVLFLTFGSVFLPIKAVLMSLISISASFGALVFIFQQGHLESLLGFNASGALGAWLPVIMFAILFGLSMDYEVLLLSRIRERYLAHGDNTRAVAEGIGLTGGIITGAALIMVAVFGAFALSSITFLKALGFTMALAVLIDATLVRGILVPAFMRVMGSSTGGLRAGSSTRSLAWACTKSRPRPMERPQAALPLPRLPERGRLRGRCRAASLRPTAPTSTA